MTPYYSEETVYSKTDLEKDNEDGVSIIFYLQKIYPGNTSSQCMFLLLLYFLWVHMIGIFDIQYYF